MKAVYGAAAAVVIGLTVVFSIAYFAAPPTDSEHDDGSANATNPTSEVAVDPASPPEFDHLTASTFVESLSVRDLLTYPVHGTVQRASFATLLTETGVQIGAPIVIDDAEARRLEVDFARQTSFAAPRESGGSRLHALLRMADPKSKLRLAVQLDRNLQIGFLITSEEAAQERLLTLVPQNLLNPNTRPVLLAPATSPVVSASKPKTQAKVALASTEDLVVKRQREFAESFEGRLYQLAQRMGMKLRIDWDSIRVRELRYLTPSSFQGFAPSGGAAIDELKTLLDKNPGPLAYAIIRDTADGDTIVITTIATLADLGPNPTLKMFLARSPHGTVFEVQPPSVGMLTVSQGLKQPINGTAREMPLMDALKELAAQAGFTIKIEAAELEAAGFSIDAKVMFEPRHREARAVLYDLLYQVDSEQNRRVVYCYEKLPDGSFRFVVTTREAALKERRTIPSDLSFEPDDI